MSRCTMKAWIKRADRIDERLRKVNTAIGNIVERLMTEETA